MENPVSYPLLWWGWAVPSVLNTTLLRTPSACHRPGIERAADAYDFMPVTNELREYPHTWCIVFWVHLPGLPACSPTGACRYRGSVDTACALTACDMAFGTLTRGGCHTVRLKGSPQEALRWFSEPYRTSIRGSGNSDAFIWVGLGGRGSAERPEMTK